MKTLARLPVACLAALAMTGQALAGDFCARPEEAIALKTAAVQQELMVAALTCGDTGAYNDFVLSHRRELQRSDADLQGYFRRTRGGDDGYNAYKTALANNSSLRSLHSPRAFCAEADAAFGGVMQYRMLADFVAAQPPGEEQRYPACERRADRDDTVAGGSSARSASRW